MIFNKIIKNNKYFLKILKIILICIIINLIFSRNLYAKYNYKYNINAFSLARDNSEIIYNIIRTGDESEYTNKDVLLNINFNKEIENVDGFEISEDKKTLTKLIKENETDTITVEDVSGNKKEVYYNINNIDKIPPEILGIDNGKIYNSNVEIDYKDNVKIKEIFVDKYSSLYWPFYPDYYETNFYKGIDVTSKKIDVNIHRHPKNTKYYMYYLNNVLKAKSEKSNYSFIGLAPGTNYTIKVDAVDKDGNVLESVTNIIKTKYFADLKATRNDINKTFTLNLTGIDSRVKNVYGIEFTNANNHKYINTTINPDRSLTATFSALDVTGTLLNDYYYFHLQFYDEGNRNLLETVCCNIIFNSNYVKNETLPIDPYNLIQNGNYQIIVTDVAGNQTEKLITINK